MRYIHLATHGFFASQGFRAGHDLMREGTGEERPAAPESRRKELIALLPGLLSGVVLSGANLALEEGAEDGILTAEEAAWLDLSATDLVVLSACETGLGTVAGGENLIGLRRALRLAGARSTVTSLWKVSDEATVELMESFNRRLWIEGKSKLEALRGAQIEMLQANRRKHGGDGLPSTWGAFVLEGSWR
jgi:CHAT domain-containing protein